MQWELWRLRKMDTPCGAPLWSAENLMNRYDSPDSAITACKTIERPGCRDGIYAVLEAEEGYVVYETPLTS